MILGEVIQFCDNYFLPLVGVFYIIAKIFIKYVLRNLLKLPFDILEVISWFGVDLCFLNFALSISTKMHNLLEVKYNAKYGAIVFWYFLLAVILTFCVFAYGYVNRRIKLGIKFNAENLGGIFLIFVGISILWGLGFVPLLFIADMIKQ